MQGENASTCKNAPNPLDAAFDNPVPVCMRKLVNCQLLNNLVHFVQKDLKYYCLAFLHDQLILCVILSNLQNTEARSVLKKKPWFYLEQRALSIATKVNN